MVSKSKSINKHVRTTVPLGSHIRTPSDSFIMHPSVVKVLKKVGVTRKNLGESEGLSFKGSDRVSILVF